MDLFTTIQSSVAKLNALHYGYFPEAPLNTALRYSLDWQVTSDKNGLTDFSLYAYSVLYEIRYIVSLFGVNGDTENAIASSFCVPKHLIRQLHATTVSDLVYLTSHCAVIDNPKRRKFH